MSAQQEKTPQPVPEAPRSVQDTQGGLVPGDLWENEVLLALLTGDQAFMWEKKHDADVVRADPVEAAHVAQRHATHLCNRPDPGLEEREVVRWVLEREEARDSVASRVLACAETFDAFTRKVLELERTVFEIIRDAPLPQSSLDATRTTSTAVGEVLWADAAAAATLKSVGLSGRAAHDRLLEQARGRAKELSVSRTDGPARPLAAGELWRLWLPRSRLIGGIRYPPLLEYIARVAWLDVFRPGVVRAWRPMLPRSVFRRLGAVMRPGGSVENGASGPILRDVHDRPITVLEAHDELGGAVLVPRELQEHLHAVAPKVLASVAAHRFLFRAVRQAREQQVVGLQRPDDLIFPGRWKELAAWLGLPMKGKSVDLARDLVLALSRVPVTFAGPKGTGWTSNLLAVTDLEAGRGRGELIITILGPLRGDIFHRIHGAERNLVPLLEPPPAVGGNRGHGLELALLTAFVGVLDERRMELAERGAVHVPLDGVRGPTWRHLADATGIDRARVATVLAGWERDEVLSTPGSDRWTLGKRYADAREALIEGGRRSRRSRSAAQRGIRAQRARRLRNHGR